MLTTTHTKNVPIVRTVDLDRAVEWEQALHLLDVDPATVSRLSQPQMQTVSRYGYRVVGELAVAQMQVAVGQRSCGPGLTTIAIGNAISGKDVAEQLQELQLEAALAGREVTCAAVGLQLPITTSETLLWQLSAECASDLVRILGETVLLSSDLPSATFARWVSHFAAQFGGKIKVSMASPEAYCSAMQDRLAEASLDLATCALRDLGKGPGDTTAIFAGCNSIARRAADLWAGAGAHIVCLADESGAIADSEGLEVASLFQHIDSGGLLVELNDVRHLLLSEAVTLPADVLLLESPGFEITETVADSINARIVFLGAQVSARNAAKLRLSDRGIQLIPSFLREAARLVEGRDLGGLWQDIAQVRDRYHTPLHTSALLVALQWITEAERASHS